MFILLCSPHSFLLIELLTTSLILISFFFFFSVALSLKSPTRGVSINYCIVLLQITLLYRLAVTLFGKNSDTEESVVDVVSVILSTEPILKFVMYLNCTFYHFCILKSIRLIADLSCNSLPDHN